MGQWAFRTAWTAAAVALLWGVAHAQYRPAPRKEAPPEADTFEEEVSLKRFRKTGNIGWDTQELLHSGLTALHEEHQEILKELRERMESLESRLKGLEQRLDGVEAKL